MADPLTDGLNDAHAELEMRVALRDAGQRPWLYRINDSDRAWMQGLLDEFVREGRGQGEVAQAMIRWLARHLALDKEARDARSCRSA